MLIVADNFHTETVCHYFVTTTTAITAMVITWFDNYKVESSQQVIVKSTNFVSWL